MKIARVESFLFNPGATRNLLFCRIETDEGHHGWGEAYVNFEIEKTVDEFLKAMAPHLIGRSPFDIRHTGQVLFDDLVIRRGSMGFYAAWSAIEIALWDIIGKAAGQPVYNLIGGRSRERVKVYANGWADGARSRDDMIARARRVKADGFTALKFNIVPGPTRTFVSRADEDYAVETVRLMREALGPNMQLMVEMNRRLAPMHAVAIGRRIAEYDIAWLEEPCLADNIALTAEVRRSLPMPIVTGETLYSKEEFCRLFEGRAADIINPDVAAVGGITAMMDIAAMAQPHAVAIAPHNNNSTLAGLAATVHVSAALTNFLIAECFIDRFEACEAISSGRFRPVKGFIDLPTAPGLGFDIDVDKLRKLPYATFPLRALRKPFEEFPRRTHAVKQPGKKR